MISSSIGSNDVAQSSRLKPIALPVWLAASSCCKRYSLTSCGLLMKMFTVEPEFNSQNDRGFMHWVGTKNQGVKEFRRYMYVKPFRPNSGSWQLTDRQTDIQTDSLWQQSPRLYTVGPYGAAKTSDWSERTHVYFSGSGQLAGGFRASQSMSTNISTAQCNRSQYFADALHSVCFSYTVIVKYFYITLRTRKLSYLWQTRLMLPQVSRSLSKSGRSLYVIRN